MNPGSHAGLPAAFAQSPGLPTGLFQKPVCRATCVSSRKSEFRSWGQGSLLWSSDPASPQNMPRGQEPSSERICQPPPIPLSHPRPRRDCSQCAEGSSVVLIPQTDWCAREPGSSPLPPGRLALPRPFLLLLPPRLDQLEVSFGASVDFPPNSENLGLWPLKPLLTGPTLCPVHVWSWTLSSVFSVHILKT